VALRLCQWLRFSSPLIKPDVRIFRIRLSDQLHCKASRRRSEMHASEAQHAQFAVNLLTWELADATPFHLVPPREEITNAFIDVIVDRPIRR
jgi:hypothetical protein